LFAGLVHHPVSTKRQGDIDTVGVTGRRIGWFALFSAFYDAVATDSRFGLAIFVASVSGNTVSIVAQFSPESFEITVATVFDTN
jgi:hypothetical protein